MTRGKQYQSRLIKENEKIGAYGTHVCVCVCVRERERERVGMYAGLRFQNSKERGHLEYLGVDGMIIIKWILKK